MTEYEKLIVPCDNAEELIKGRIGKTAYDQIVSQVKSKNMDFKLALNFTANFLKKEFASEEEYIDFLNSVIPELAGEKAVLAYILGMLYTYTYFRFAVKTKS